MPRRSFRLYLAERTENAVAAVLRHEDGAYSYREISIGENLDRLSETLQELTKEKGLFRNLFSEEDLLSPEERDVQRAGIRRLSRLPEGLPGTLLGVKIKGVAAKYLVFRTESGLPEVTRYGGTLGKGSYLHARRIPGTLQVIKTLLGSKKEQTFLIYNAQRILKWVNPGGFVRGLQPPPVILSYQKKGVFKPALIELEYLGDGNRYLLERAQLATPFERVAECGELIEALNTLHLKGVHHGDIKLGNLLYSESGPILADFGGSGMNAPARIWTPHYTPLRLTLGRAYTLAHGLREDLHALGVVLLDLARGSSFKRQIELLIPPGAENLPNAFYNQVIYHEMPALCRALDLRIQELKKSDPELAAIIRKMVITNPAHPGQVTADEIVSDWNTYIEAKKKGGDPSPETRRNSLA